MLIALLIFIRRAALFFCYDIRADTFAVSHGASLPLAATRSHYDECH